MSRARRARASLPALLGLLASGCASMLPQLQPPALTVTTIEFAGGSLRQQQLHLALHAVNPNDRAIMVRGIECTLELEGQPFASGTTDAAFTLPARGATDFGLNVTANLNSALLVLLSGLSHRTVEYHLYGRVHLGGGLVRVLPFDHSSQLRL